MPDVYTHGHQDAVLRAHRWRTVANSAAYLLPWLHAGKRLLDVGCGPGTLTADLARHVSPGQVVGVDMVDAVVAEAAEYAHAQGVANVEFRTGDFRDLPDSGFDIVHAHQVLQHLQDPVGALRAMAARARPGGVVAARDGDYSGFVWAPADSGLDAWRAIYHEVTRRNGAEPDAGRHLLGWARQAGLHDARYTSSTWTFATPEERAWWGELWAERCVRSSLAQQAQDYGIATPAELAEAAAGWRRWSEAPDGVMVIPHGELVAVL